MHEMIIAYLPHLTSRFNKNKISKNVLMEPLTKQQHAAVLLSRTLDDFFKKFIETSEVTLRFNFFELTDFLFNREMKDEYELNEKFMEYIHQLYKLSLVELQAQHNGTFHGHFMSLKLVKELPNLKTQKIKNLFKFLENEFKTEQKIPTWTR